jgi:hypothetical protein
MKLKDENSSPAEEQQELNLGDALAQSYDEMDAAGDDNEHFENDDIEEHQVEEVAAETTQEDDEEQEPETAQADEVTEYNEPAPERWPEDLKKVYNELPPVARKAMLEGVYKPMQATYTQSTQELAQQRKQLDPMLKTLEQHASEFKTAGINPVEAFNRQMAWSAHFAKVGPEQGAKDLAKAYGQAGGQQEGQTEESVYLTPVERAQQERLEKLEGMIQGQVKQTEAQKQAAAQRAQEARQAEVRNSITAFANEERDGQPIHPHVEKVSAQMAGLIRGGLVNRTDEYGQPVPFTQQLGQAYKLACEMDPSIRNARQARTRKEQVAKVSAANRDVVSKTPGNVVEVDERPLAESIGDLYDRLDRSAA